MQFFLGSSLVMLVKVDRVYEIKLELESAPEPYKV